MRPYILLLLLILALPAGFAVAGGEAPSQKAADPLAAKSGTNLKGESCDFQTYLDQTKAEEKESNCINLVDLGEDAKIAAGGDDTEVGLKMGFE